MTATQRKTRGLTASYSEHLLTRRFFVRVRLRGLGAPDGTVRGAGFTQLPASKESLERQEQSDERETHHDG